MQNEQLKLIIGEDLADVLAKDDAAILTSRIRNLRKEREYVIPLVHITDEIKTDKNSYEIRISDKLIIKQEVPENKDCNLLIDEIILNLDKVCKAKWNLTKTK